MKHIILFIVIILIILFTKSYESFNQDQYKSYVFDEKLKSQEYLSFLENVYSEFKKKTKTIDKLTDDIENDILSPIYKKWDENTPNKTIYKKELNKKGELSIDCTALSNHLCQYTDPNFYISSDRVYAPPPWLIKSYKDLEYPKQTNLKCFNENFACCKKSLT